MIENSQEQNSTEIRVQTGKPERKRSLSLSKPNNVLDDDEGKAQTNRICTTRVNSVKNLVLPNLSQITSPKTPPLRTIRFFMLVFEINSRY